VEFIICSGKKLVILIDSEESLTNCYKPHPTPLLIGEGSHKVAREVNFKFSLIY
jgi:hypothetical protein